MMRQIPQRGWKQAKLFVGSLRSFFMCLTIRWLQTRVLSQLIYVHGGVENVKCWIAALNGELEGGAKQTGVGHWRDKKLPPPSCTAMWGWPPDNHFSRPVANFTPVKKKCLKIHLTTAGNLPPLSICVISTTIFSILTHYASDFQVTRHVITMSCCGRFCGWQILGLLSRLCRTNFLRKLCAIEATVCEAKTNRKV